MHVARGAEFVKHCDELRETVSDNEAVVLIASDVDAPPEPEREPTMQPAEDWQSECVTRLRPLKCKDFDVELDQLTFDYGSGLWGRLQFRSAGKPKSKPVHAVQLNLAPEDAFSQMNADDLRAELERWSRWLAERPLAQLEKLSPDELKPFRQLTEAELEAAWKAWKKERDPDPAARIAEQKRVFAEVTSRFDAFAKHVKKVWGLQVPRTLIAVQALFELDLEGNAARELIIGAELRPAGVLDRLAKGGLQRKLNAGRDERCHGRYFRDPPEFLTFAHAGEDGLHFGLWYDLDDRLPSVVVSSYARDTGETHFAGDTPMGALLERVRSRPTVPGPGGFRTRLVLEILEWFHAAEAPLHAAEKARRSPTKPPPPILGGWGVRCEGTTSDCENADLAEVTLRSKPKILTEWIKEANKRLKKGDARMALVLGRSMHWMGGPQCLEKSGALLAGAYRALGRKALLGILEAHEADRMADSVDVLEEVSAE